jgi:hypothetical protein
MNRFYDFRNGYASIDLHNVFAITKGYRAAEIYFERLQEPVAYTLMNEEEYVTLLREWKHYRSMYVPPLDG